MFAISLNNLPDVLVFSLLHMSKEDFKNANGVLGLKAYAFNPGTNEAEAGRSFVKLGQLGLQKETLSQNKQNGTNSEEEE